MPAKSESKCCNCCHDSVQTIDKEKANAVEALDSKQAPFPRTFSYYFRTNSRSDLFECVLRNDAAVRRHVGDVCKPIAESLTHASKPLCN